MAWKDEVLAKISGRWQVGQTFTLDQVYEFEGHFVALYPRNQTVRDSLRRQLQELRDEGYLEFINNNGRYRRIR